MKTKLKRQKVRELKGKDGVTGQPLSEQELNDMSLIDLHRFKEKREDGEVKKYNTTIVNPVVHMKIHGIYKERSEEMNQLKTLVDARKPILRTQLASENRLKAYKRKTDHLDKFTIEWLEENIKSSKDILKKKDKEIVKCLKKINHPFIKAALNIYGVGPISVAYMIVYIDIEKAEYASSLWKYVGYDKPSHMRYQKGVSGGGNKNLRSALYVLATSFIRLNKKPNPYRDVYENEKAKLSASNLLTKSYTPSGKLKEMKWRETMPKHRHDAAIRKMMKHFLADAWKVWRTLDGFDASPLYVEEKMGHKGIVQPEERGWKI